VRTWRRRAPSSTAARAVTLVTRCATPWPPAAPGRGHRRRHPSVDGLDHQPPHQPPLRRPEGPALLNAVCGPCGNHRGGTGGLNPSLTAGHISNCNRVREPAGKSERPETGARAPVMGGRLSSYSRRHHLLASSGQPVALKARSSPFVQLDASVTSSRAWTVPRPIECRPAVLGDGPPTLAQTCHRCTRLASPPGRP
jgi:hypothetical protein